MFSGNLRTERNTERRRERRLRPHQVVTMRVLGLTPGPIMQASALDISDRGMRLRSSLSVPCGIRIEVEVHEMVALGTVCRCEPETKAYNIGLRLMSALA